jgi:hypothetical protein
VRILRVRSDDARITVTVAPNINVSQHPQLKTRSGHWRPVF